MKLIIISNRLPVKAVRKEEHYHFTFSEGGLATGLNSLQSSVDKFWIGWPEAFPASQTEERQLTEELHQHNFHPVFLTPLQIHNYYEGYSNNILWPLCHYFYSYIHYDINYWETYKEVNELFCRVASPFIEPDDIVWVQDYQLMLLPAMLRRLYPSLRIGYFHHIPFPSYELFRVLPERAEILNGLLGADLVGFHTPDYMRHFVSALDHMLSLNFEYGDVRLKDRMVRVEAFPIGINFTKYYDAPLYPVVQRKLKRLRQKFGDRKLILSVDRLDYSKGILHRLRGFELFLENHPEYRGRVSLAMIIVPSRDKVNAYAYLKRNVNELVSTINGKYSDIDWTPVYYFYHSFSFEELVAMYSLAHVALVTPLRDGMNLVAKEYVAAKRGLPGTLILSEMAGASIELTDAIIVNPNDVCEIEKAIYRALEMPTKEQTSRLTRMQHLLSIHTVNKWAADFIHQLNLICRKNESLHNKLIRRENMALIRQAYLNSRKRLIVLDYDGTLAPFVSNPEDAVPTRELYNLLQTLSSDPENTVAISSGRDHSTLERWFGHLPILLAAEHGAFYKDNGRWYNNLPEKESWNDEILHVIQEIISKTPGTRMEIKETAVVWHYRNANPWLASIREKELEDRLAEPCALLGLQIMKGNKIVEIKSPAYTKGSEAKRLMSKDTYDFILAIGDDVTDEDMFSALPPDAITVKIGSISDHARFNLQSQTETLPFLLNLVRQEVMAM